MTIALCMRMELLKSEIGESIFEKFHVYRQLEQDSPTIDSINLEPGSTISGGGEVTDLFMIEQTDDVLK